MNIRAGVVAGIRGLALAVLGLVASLVDFILAVLSIAFITLGVGAITTPWVMRKLRAHANMRRRLAREWSGVEIPVPYQPEREWDSGVVGQIQRTWWILKDPATWRDMQWLLVDATAGVFLGTLAAGMIVDGLFGFVLAAGVWKPIHDAAGTYWYTFLPVQNQGTAFAAAGVGVAYLALAFRYNPAILATHARVTRAFLGPNHERELQMRVERLTETRSEAIDTSAAELRRIERDLHDGAQARLVAMGMSLGTIEHLLRTDPEAAARMVAEARKSSAEALTELRDLVRGIHPPVLAERGLGDAVRALAMRSPVKTETTIDLPGRFPAPVESAAYFAVSEVLTNAAKHAEAQRIWIDVRYDEDDRMLRVSVTDDGRGGADIAKGTGLAGIERRLGTFDGILALSSPQGGPTMVTMELPCVLSSPRTSSS